MKIAYQDLPKSEKINRKDDVEASQRCLDDIMRRWLTVALDPRHSSAIPPEMQSRLRRSIDKAASGNEQLSDIYRTAAETEGIGHEILSNLNAQRSVIENTRNNVRVASNRIGTANDTLGAMTSWWSRLGL